MRSLSLLVALSAVSGCGSDEAGADPDSDVQQSADAAVVDASVADAAEQIQFATKQQCKSYLHRLAKASPQKGLRVSLSKGGPWTSG